jgi:serine phosphatase RsbU (regulator of sigma subunit)
VPGWEWAVTGDYYELFEVAPGQVAVALGDMPGKGLGPTLIMASLHALASRTTGRPPGPTEPFPHRPLPGTMTG